jgi:hypothetical protein
MSRNVTYPCFKCGREFNNAATRDLHTERHEWIEYAHRYLAKLRAVTESSMATASAGHCDDCDRFTGARHRIGQFTTCTTCARRREAASRDRTNPPPAIRPAEQHRPVVGGCQACGTHTELTVTTNGFRCHTCTTAQQEGAA